MCCVVRTPQLNICRRLQLNVLNDDHRALRSIQVRILSHKRICSVPLTIYATNRPPYISMFVLSIFSPKRLNFILNFTSPLFKGRGYVHHTMVRLPLHPLPTETLEQ